MARISYNRPHACQRKLVANDPAGGSALSKSSASCELVAPSGLVTSTMLQTASLPAATNRLRTSSLPTKAPKAFRPKDGAGIYTKLGDIKYYLSVCRKDGVITIDAARSVDTWCEQIHYERMPDNAYAIYVTDGTNKLYLTICGENQISTATSIDGECQKFVFDRQLQSEYVWDNPQKELEDVYGTYGVYTAIGDDRFYLKICGDHEAPTSQKQVSGWCEKFFIESQESVLHLNGYGVPEDGTSAFEAALSVIRASGKSGTIIVPPGDWHISRPVQLTVNDNFLTIKGHGGGFATGTGKGGGTRLLVRCDYGFAAPKLLDESKARLSGVHIRDLLLDGESPNFGRIGIFVEQDSDALRLEGVVAKEFLTGFEVWGADAASIVNCYAMENTNCLRLPGASQAAVVANNFFGGKPQGITVFFEGAHWLTFTGNTVFPDGYANLVIKNCVSSVITGNAFKSYNYKKAMIHLEGKSNENTVSGNTLLLALPDKYKELKSAGKCTPTWDCWDPSGIRQDVNFGLIHVNGNNNLISSNTIVSKATEYHMMVNVAVGAEGNTLADLALTRSVAGLLIDINGGSQENPTVVRGCAPRKKVRVQPGVWAALDLLPEAVQAS